MFNCLPFHSYFSFSAGKLDRAHHLCHQGPPKTRELNQRLPRSRKPFAYKYLNPTSGLLAMPKQITVAVPINEGSFCIAHRAYSWRGIQLCRYVSLPSYEL
jgi:hypothetical protein